MCRVNSPNLRLAFDSSSVSLGLDRSSRGRDARSLKAAVLVLGMHRSGTSSVAGALMALGGSAPLHLMPPQEDNERGFWESAVLTALNDEILAAGGSAWPDWRAFDPERIDPAAAGDLHARAISALANEFGDAGLPIVKDPRMCRLMRLWAPVFEEAEWSVRALLPLRSPLEVVFSLNHRDGVSLSYGCLMWLRHVLDAEAETRGMARAVLDWQSFLDDRRGALTRVAEQLRLTWPRWGETALAEIDEFVSADLRHHSAGGDDLRAHPAICDLARETYAAMIELVEDPGNGRVLRTLDDLRLRLEAAALTFDCPMHELEEAIGVANREISRANAIIAHVADRYAEMSRSSNRTVLCAFQKARSNAPTPSFVDSNELETIRNSVFFDAKHYLETNPDVRAAGADPALHYLLHGGLEGRAPGPFFSTVAYLARYPAVAEAGLNALVHYETYGRLEKRNLLGEPILL
jgi:hypothetical protein